MTPKIEEEDLDLESYRDRPKYLQCSICFQYYSFNEYLALKSEWVNPKKHQFGKTAICQCGNRFHKRKWAIMSRKDNYVISTVHLEIGAGNGTLNLTDMDQDYFYETMIFHKTDLTTKEFDEPLDFQIRYKTMEDAKRGHKDTYDRLENIILNPEKYPMGVIPAFCNAMKAGLDQQKRIKPDVKERLK